MWHIFFYFVFFLLYNDCQFLQLLAHFIKRNKKASKYIIPMQAGTHTCIYRYIYKPICKICTYSRVCMHTGGTRTGEGERGTTGDCGPKSSYVYSCSQTESELLDSCIRLFEYSSIRIPIRIRIRIHVRQLQLQLRQVPRETRHELCKECATVRGTC